MEEEWIIAIDSKLASINPSDEAEKQRKRCIYKVPAILRSLNENAYTPQLISFGPYHHHQAHLRHMEPCKCLALSNYLKRAGKTVGAVARMMRPEVREMMECYDELDEIWRDDERFLEMMIVDGCFLLDLMIWNTVDFWKPYMAARSWIDMLRLENQLPLAVLAVLIEMGGHKTEDTKKFIEYYDPKSTNQPETIREMGLHHLGIYQRHVTSKGYYFYDPYSSVRLVTELHQAGVRFLKSKSNSLKDISFTNGVLKLPYIKVDHNTEPLLLNCLAYEQILNVDNAVTSYAFLMDDLINSGKDVIVLREKGIIRGWVGSDDDIAALFNRLTKALMYSIGKGKVNVNKKLNGYCNKRRNRWRASIMQMRPSGPWVFISLMGALIMLISAVVQTAYTVLSYYNGS